MINVTGSWSGAPFVEVFALKLSDDNIAERSELRSARVIERLFAFFKRRATRPVFDCAVPFLFKTNESLRAPMAIETET